MRSKPDEGEEPHGCHCIYTRSTAPANSRVRLLHSLLVILLSWSSLFGGVSAHGHRSALLLPVVPEQDTLAWKGSPLLLDNRPPPLIPLFMPSLHIVHDASKALSAPPSKRSITTDPKVSATAFTVPSAFDTGMSNNFSTSCSAYLNRLRQNKDFNDCHPFSLLLQTSSGFFDASRSFLRITQTLDATCGVNVKQCTATLDGLARELVTDTACKTDYDNDNPIVLQAYNGLIAYEASYQASCLKSDTGNYCFADAVSNTTSTTDSYPYYLPIGQILPGGSRPTCNTCLQDAMAIFASFAGNHTQPISKTYTSAAQQLAISCGKDFVSTTAAPLKGAATTSTPAALTPTLTLLLMFILYFFQ
ncbi:hypothetical protein P153DRAFT_285070 [Dothidotthia symphoricarpi CBS 119687]|uniref:DUF7729 domain-containing protein n=1 Tax=Dothidotthia symphoricarpi CBS 119687 TaxID=1392245 RepID=A0A6A6AP64_9PLEO|nr:uncharacterized protein P153DRAFT_285070 [Dothidotthia symphoricarpi CBS 119687]KAF2132291.1 hypothetical protein P153DRAFT_285070 [Dothidotthia symphoricarpi CBS 119687]